MNTSPSLFTSNKAKTDEEYIEFVRRRLRISRTTSYLSLCIGLGLLALGIAIPFVIFKVFSTGMADMNRIWTEAQAGLWFGWLLGAFGGLFILLGVVQIGSFFAYLTGNRTEKLLLKYFDSQNENICQQSGAGYPPQGVGSPDP